MNDIIDESTPELAGVIALWLQSARPGQQTTFIQDNQFNRLERKVEKVRTPAIAAANAWFLQDEEELIEHEIEFTDDLLRDNGVTSVKTPTQATVNKALLATGSYLGLTIAQWFERLRASDLARIMSTTRFGVTQGLTDTQIVRSVIGTRAQDFINGVLNTTRNAVRTLARTITTGVAGDARASVYKVNPTIKLERYTAILDHRTSIICINLDGTIVPVGQGPRPPQHRNCRSFMVPVIPGEEEDPLITYPEWLRKQPVKFQNEVLGPGRAKLWREGKVSAGDFVDRSGKILTIERLRKLEN
jgi:SPP1 gp7 family putative phage head morphogenesis protein